MRRGPVWPETSIEAVNMAAADIQGANNSLIDGLVRYGRSTGMTVDQLKEAGQTLAATLRESVASYPLLAEFFPGVGEGLLTLAGLIETALTDLTRDDIAPDLKQRIDDAYHGAVGKDALGRPMEIGPLLQGELVDFAKGFQGAPAELDAALRQRILASYEVSSARRELVEQCYQTLLGRPTTLAERNELKGIIDGILAGGGTLEDVGRQIQQRIRESHEMELMQKVGMIFAQVFPRDEPPSVGIERSWTDWVLAMTKRGMSEEQALALLPSVLVGQ